MWWMLLGQISRALETNIDEGCTGVVDEDGEWKGVLKGVKGQRTAGMLGEPHTEERSQFGRFSEIGAVS